MASFASISVFDFDEVGFFGVVHDALGFFSTTNLAGVVHDALGFFSTALDCMADSTLQ